MIERLTVSEYDIARVRGLYSTIGSGTAYLEGALAPVQPQSVVGALIATLRQSPAPAGARTTRSKRAASSIVAARAAFSDIVGARTSDVVLGGNVADLTVRLAVSLSADWQLGDEIVLSRYDGDAAVLAWRRVAHEKGVIVRWAEVDLESGEVPAWQYRRLIGPRTRLVTVALGNPTTGALPDLSEITALAHKRGAMVVVDAGVAVNHVPLDLADLDVDVLLLSATAIGGPSVAAFATRPGLLEEIVPDSVRPASRAFEPGTLPIELLEGVVAAVDHLADLDSTATGTRRERLLWSVTAAGEHTAGLYATLDKGLRQIPGVTVLGSSVDRLPVLAFTVDGRTAEEVGDALNSKRIAVWTGSVGLSELARSFGLDEVGGAVHVGLMPYSNTAEVTRLLDALNSLVRP